MIEFYCGINEKTWNHHPVAPGRYVCVAPVYGSSAKTRRNNGVYVPSGSEVIQDSGAFSDNWGDRLSFQAALDRQRSHADRYGYTSMITHRASYDLLIDEKWQDGKRTKQRWAESDAWAAVDETVAAAEFLLSRRDGLALVLSVQGVSAPQYLECAKQVIPLLDLDRDLLGLGGWCIIGKLPAQMMPVFRDTCDLVIPFAGEQGVRRIHIWGVLYAPALAYLLYKCDQVGIAVSTDSSGPSRRPCFGQWGYADWTDLSYKRPDPAVRGLERARHVEAVRGWLSGFRAADYYSPGQQLGFSF